MISVCMATYNGEKYVKQQLQSILEQLSDDDEVIVSDDKSTDGTLDVIKSLNDKRVRIFVNQRSKHGLEKIQLVTTNFENALNHSHGDIIFLSDQDDVWADDKVKVSLKYLEKYDYIVSNYYITDENLNVVKESNNIKNRWKYLITSTPYTGSCAAFKRKVLDKAMPFPKGLQSHDRWIGFIASFFYKYDVIPEKLLYYRRNNGSASTTTLEKDVSDNTVGKRISIRLFYIIHLLKVAFR